MIKSPFNYFKPQLIALCVLLLLCVVAVLVDVHVCSVRREPSADDSLRLASEFSLFRSSLRDDSSFCGHGSRYSHSSVPARLFRFNPNSLDSAGFVSLGLPRFIAARIVHYRMKGGVFRTKRDLSRIYGLSHDDFMRLYPYIDLPENVGSRSASSPSVSSVSVPIASHKSDFKPIDINGSDSASLVAAGVSPGVARCLMRDCRKLGGFVSREQVRESLKWMKDSRKADSIASRVVFDLSKVRKINVNAVSIDRLRSHPYINFYQARAIYEFRRTHGRLSSVSELSGIKDKSITPEFLSKVSPYLEAK